MVFLTLRRWYAVAACGPAETLALVYYRGCGVLGDHEAAVEARVGNEERGQTACAADELVDTALRDIS